MRRSVRKRKLEELNNNENITECILVCDSCSDEVEGTNTLTSDTGASNQLKKLDTSRFDHYSDNIQRTFSRTQQAPFAFLDSLWFSLYMDESSRQKSLSWIKRKRIFSKKYVVIPIVCWSHWSLLILCHFGERSKSKFRTRCMLLLDSLHAANPRRLEPEIRKFVMDIFNVEGRHEDKSAISQIPLLVPKVPQQINGEDCGYFVLYFMKLFVEKAPAKFTTNKGYPYFMKEDWFCQEDLDKFCSELGPRDL